MRHIISICPLAVEQEAQNGMSSIHYIKPRPESLTTTFQHNILTAQHVADKLRIHSVVALRKARTVSMAQPGYNDISAILCPISHTERLGCTLRRRITSPHRCTVHVTAACLCELAAVALAVNLARRDVHHALHAMLQAKLYQMSNTIKIRLHHLHRFLTEEVGTRITCCIYNKVYTLR